MSMPESSVPYVPIATVCEYAPDKPMEMAVSDPGDLTALQTDWSDELDDLGDDVEPMSPEILAELDKKDRIAELYVRGFVIPEGENWDGITGKDMQSWYAGLDDNAREEMEMFLQANKSRATDAKNVESRVAESAPELLEGTLPKELEALAGGRYVLGANQSGVDTVTEAQAYLARTKGVSLEGYKKLSQRFLFFQKGDDEYAKHAVTKGYLQGAGGRFITVTPMVGEAAQYADGALDMSMDTAWKKGALPADYIVVYTDETGKQRESVNPKYVAGFVDNDGNFSANAGFMKSAEPSLLGLNNLPEEEANWV